MLRQRAEQALVQPNWRDVLEREYSQFRETVSQWQAIQSIAEKIGCTSETLRRWLRQAERDAIRPSQLGKPSGDK